jgi:3-carboxy-cis,cis-muconate cycloisomerase
MPAAPADSAIYRELFGDAETASFFSDAAEVQAMLRVEAALAQVQGDLGLIPGDAAARIVQALDQARIDPAGLAAATARNGVPVPGLLAAVREAAGPLDGLHGGATSQDIVDTALALRLAPVLDLWACRLDDVIAGLGALAARHADLPMAARTYGQAAVPTTFGAVVAAWGRPLIRHRVRLVAVRADVLCISLGGAAGTLSAMGTRGPEVRAALALALGLKDAGPGGHSERDGIVAVGQWMAGLTASLGKMAEDLLLATQTGIAEVTLTDGGGSSTMPQKHNPVGPSVLLALARQVAGLSATLTGAALHRQQRDGAAWFTEWLTLPQMCISTGRALTLARDMARAVAPDPAAMARGLTAGAGTIHAEALTFALTTRMTRVEAEQVVKALCARAIATGPDLLALAAADWPDLTINTGTGQAAADARAFAAAAGQ